MRSTKSPPPLRVLIAEAHPIEVLGLTDLLHTLGYVLIGSVASGQEAILAAAAHQPDLMLVDVDLKGEMDGIAVPEPGSDRHPALGPLRKVWPALTLMAVLVLSGLMILARVEHWFG